jgi:Uma2 family endonuclease
VVAAEKLAVSDDLMKISSNGRYELIEGVIYEMSPTGEEHGFIAWKIMQKIGAFVEKNKLGIITSSETGYKLSSNPDTVRAPDAAFKSNKKLSECGGVVKDYSTIMPELVVEVNSPSDSYTKIAGKVKDWLKSGVKIVWVIEPSDKTVAVYDETGNVNVLNKNDYLDGGDILAGFKCNVGEIFKIHDA